MQNILPTTNFQPDLWQYLHFNQIPDRGHLTRLVSVWETVIIITDKSHYAESSVGPFELRLKSKWLKTLILPDKARRCYSVSPLALFSIGTIKKHSRWLIYHQYFWKAWDYKIAFFKIQNILQWIWG